MPNSIAVADRIQSHYSHEQDSFLEGYEWCLNPILTVRDLFKRAGEELIRLKGTTVKWELDEAKTNLYLHVCAISCTADDFLARRRFYVRPVEKSFPRLRTLIRSGENLLNLPGDLWDTLKYRSLRKWKNDFDSVVEKVCRLLLSSADEVGGLLSEIENGLTLPGPSGLPPDLLEARMRLNEGYRCQDLCFRDVITLVDRFLESKPDPQDKYVIVGSRTAGSYFAPLVKVHLEHHGFRDVSWTTLRPKYGTHGTHRRRLGRMLGSGTHVILTDDYSNSGRTFRMMEEIVNSFDVPSKQIVMLAPIHPAREIRFPVLKPGREGEKPAGRLSSSSETEIVAIRHDDLHLRKLMEPGCVEMILKELIVSDEIVSVSIVESAWAEETNRKLWSRYAEGFQVRLKRVYDVMLRLADGTEKSSRILAKGVGQGWLGYHAYIAGRALEEFTPEVIGIRQGIMFMEWVEGRQFTLEDLSPDSLSKMSSYLSTRSGVLRLKEDPRSNSPYLSWGWMGILSILRRAYHPLLGRVKDDVLLEKLKKILRYKPALVDGKMRPGEWRVTRTGIVKLDFEQHCFGAPELDVVDPAYDIAVASFEFYLSEVDEEEMIFRYGRESGDADTLKDRIFLYKLLYATIESERTLHRILSVTNRKILQDLNNRMLWSWNFRVYTMNRFAFGLLKKSVAQHRKSGLFFMDIDGVFDREAFGFPHTTVDGLTAISLLLTKGYSVIPNTGRSCENVRDYCVNFGFAGGIAEYGSAIVDVQEDYEIPLVSDETLSELSRCREILKNTAGIFVDNTYRYAVRAYRYGPHGTSGLTTPEVKDLVEHNGFSRVKAIVRGADTYFIGKETDKGKAIEAYTMRCAGAGELTAAMGDSSEDVPMLRSVRFAFAPANCAPAIRQLEREGKCTITQKGYQAGLLQAVEHLVHSGRHSGRDSLLNIPEEDSLQLMMYQLMAVADLPAYERMLSVLKRKSLL